MTPLDGGVHSIAPFRPGLEIAGFTANRRSRDPGSAGRQVNAEPAGTILGNRQPPLSPDGPQPQETLQPAFLTRIWRHSDSLFIINVLVLNRMGFNKTGCFQDALCGLRQTGGVRRLRRRRDHLGGRCPVTAQTGAPDTSVRTHGGLFHRSPGSRTPNPCPSRPVGSTGLRDGARL